MCGGVGRGHPACAGRLGHRTGTSRASGEAALPSALTVPNSGGSRAPAVDRLQRTREAAIGANKAPVVGDAPLPPALARQASRR